MNTLPGVHFYRIIHPFYKNVLYCVLHGARILPNTIYYLSLVVFTMNRARLLHQPNNKKELCYCCAMFGWRCQRLNMWIKWFIWTSHPFLKTVMLRFWHDISCFLLWWLLKCIHTYLVNIFKKPSDIWRNWNHDKSIFLAK